MNDDNEPSLPLIQVRNQRTSMGYLPPNLDDEMKNILTNDADYRDKKHGRTNMFALVDQAITHKLRGARLKWIQIPQIRNQVEDYEKRLYVEQAGPNGISLALVNALFPLTNRGNTARDDTVRDHLKRLDAENDEDNNHGINNYVILKVHATIPNVSGPTGKHITANIIIP
jgi:hypothetical protein